MIQDIARITGAAIDTDQNQGNQLETIQTNMTPAAGMVGPNPGVTTITTTLDLTLDQETTKKDQTPKTTTSRDGHTNKTEA